MDVHTAEGLLDHTFVLFLVFNGLSIVLSVVAALITLLPAV